MKTATDGCGYTKMAYDAYGRTERTVPGSYESSNTSVYGVNAFAEDIILSESVPTYYKSGLVLYATSYSRNHDAPTEGLGAVKGLLSLASANARRISYNATRDDVNGRSTQNATYGTNGFAAISYETDPDEIFYPDDLGRSDDYLVSKTEYDDAGRSYITTDNSSKMKQPSKPMHSWPMRRWMPIIAEAATILIGLFLCCQAYDALALPPSLSRAPRCRAST